MSRPRPAPPHSPLPTSTSLITGQYLPEPLLLFADDGLHVDPKSGIARYGPRSRTSTGRHPVRLRVGLVGASEQVDNAKKWLIAQAAGVNGDEKNPANRCRLAIPPLMTMGSHIHSMPDRRVGRTERINAGRGLPAGLLVPTDDPHSCTDERLRAAYIRR